MPTARLTNSKAFLLLLIALLQLAWTPRGEICAVEDRALEDCCVEMESAPPLSCCEEPGAPRPPEAPHCPCAVHPGPGPMPAKPFLVDGGSSSLEAWAAVPVARVTPRADRDVRAIPPVGLGPPVYRLHCVLLI
jgi:hypothetical protein